MASKAELQAILEKLHRYERVVLPVLEETTELKAIAQETSLQEVSAMRALQWLSNKNVLEINTTEKEAITLDSNGRTALEKGLPERRFLEALGEPCGIVELPKKTGLSKEEINVSLGLLKKQGLVEFRPGKGGKVLATTDKVDAFLAKESLEENFLKSLKDGRELGSLTPEEKHSYDQFKKRQFMVKTTTQKKKTIALTKLGKDLIALEKKLGITKQEVIDRLTPNMLGEGDWKTKKFRPYDVEINVPRITGGKKHFVNQAIEYAKKIWLDLGFKEMSGNMVHTSFWDMDALFIPQDHPARQMQDTFFIGRKDISKGTLPKKFAQRVKDVHEHGGDTGSTGWQTQWSEEEASKLLLRTHTTVLSALKLAELKKEDLPAKFFNVGKVFRNEALDWKHLFEFHQVDGIVIDPDANLKHLKGYLKTFFKKMGFPDARIRPAHFPYTEPSCEVDVWHPVKKEWIEIAGAGIFRPEVVKPLLGIDVPVLAWGIGLERLIVDYYGIKDLRDIYSNDLKQLRDMKTWLK